MFWSQEAIKKRCREIIAATPEDGPADYNNRAFLTDLLARHPDGERKLGCGIAYFAVRTTWCKNRCFWIVRIDGTEEDFSFLKCASGKGTSKKRDFLAAARCAIRPSIIEFRAARFGSQRAIPSDISGELVTLETCHVDHESPTFYEIVEQYLEEYPDRIENPVTQGVGTDFVQPDDAEHFRRFHDGGACLRIVTASENLKWKNKTKT